MNSPETPLFHKGAGLYNLHQARKAAHETGRVIVVEGYVDAIALSAAGFRDVVAPLGTALTPEQCSLLWQMAPEPTLCFDGDKAGRKAADRALDTALPLLGPGRALRFAFLPEGQDPDDLVRQDGPEAVAAILDAARPMVDVLWARETEAAPLDTPERRADLERRLGALVATIGDEALRRHYRDEIGARLSALRPGDRGEPGRAAPPRRGSRRFADPRAILPLGYKSAPVRVTARLQRTADFGASTTLPRREAEILLNLVNHPRLLARHGEDLAGLDFASREAARLRDLLVALSAEPLDAADALREAAENAAPGLVERVERAAQPVYWCIKPEAADADAEQTLHQALTLHRRARALHKELGVVERELGEDLSEANLARLRDVKAELDSLDGQEALVEGFGLSSGRQGPVL